MNEKVRLGATFLFVAVLVAGMISHAPIVWNVLRQRMSFEKSVTVLHGELRSRFRRKDSFVDVSGLYVRLLGRRLHNQVVKLANGQLQVLRGIEQADEQIARAHDSATRIRDLFVWLNGKGIRSLYLQAPTKMDVDETLCPFEVAHGVYEKVDIVCSELRTNGFEVVDMRNLLAATVEDIGRNFYRTDHHWRIGAAFDVFPVVVDRMVALLGQDRKDAARCTDPHNWLCQTRESWFLGSWGRRVGRFYAGLDDIAWYEPKFETHLSCAVSAVGQINVGRFADALVRYAWFLDKRPSLHGSNPYSLYVGGNFPLVAHRNATASVRKRILLVADSFVLPMQAFLATVFSEMDVLDLRSFGEMSLCDYVDAYGPDLVVFLYNPGSIGAEATFCFGLSPERQMMPVLKELPCRKALNLAKTGGVNRYEVIADRTLLKNGGLYRLQIGDLSIDGVEPGVTVCLHDPENGRFCEKRVIDVEYASVCGETLAFKVPAMDQWNLILFAGRSPSVGIGVRVGKLALQEVVLR